MSESKVYYAPYFSTDPIPGGHEIVSAADYRAAQSELANAKRVAITEIEGLSRTLQNQAKALVAAEERNDDLCQLIRELTANGLTLNAVYRKRVDAALKPTESGASE